MNTLNMKDFYEWAETYNFIPDYEPCKYCDSDALSGEIESEYICNTCTNEIIGEEMRAIAKDK